jgi:hypothetical protein
MKHLLILLLWLTGIAPVQADPQSKSFSSWSVDAGQVEVIYRIASREVTRLPAYQYNPDLAQVLDQHLDKRLQVSHVGASCQVLSAITVAAEAGFLRYIGRWQCPADAATIAVRNSALFEVAPSHIHFARFHLTGHESFERLYTRHNTEQQIALSGSVEVDDSSSWETLRVYAGFGFEHILIGLDHIAFLMTLLILARRIRDVIFIVTGFTLGHSLTLSLTVLGMATPSPMVVEAFIGFTIAFVAVENVSATYGRSRKAALSVALCMASLALIAGLSHQASPVLALLGLGLFGYCYLRLADTPERARQMRPAVTTLFGLVHGFGFASVLLEVGMPGNAVIPALVGFNIGVELGQVTIVLVLALLGVGLAKILQNYRPLASSLLNASLCSLGSYWFIQRLFFG